MQPFKMQPFKLKTALQEKWLVWLMLKAVKSILKTFQFKFSITDKKSRVKNSRFINFMVESPTMPFADLYSAQ